MSASGTSSFGLQDPLISRLLEIEIAPKVSSSHTGSRIPSAGEVKYSFSYYDNFTIMRSNKIFKNNIKSEVKLSLLY